MFSVTAVSAGADWDNPKKPFDTKSNYVNEVTIKWIPVDNIQSTCEQESKKRGYGGFGYGVDACSFFSGNQCVIFTKKTTDMHTLGHETRHCFQGSWH